MDTDKDEFDLNSSVFIGVPSVAKNAFLHVFLRALRVSYVQKAFYRFYFPSSCSRDDERSEESCEHDDWPTTDRASVHNDRREARFKPVPCRFARTGV